MTRIVLLDSDGQVVQEYLTDETFRRIEHDGRWYYSQHKAGLPNVYQARVG